MKWAVSVMVPVFLTCELDAANAPAMVPRAQGSLKEARPLRVFSTLRDLPFSKGQSESLIPSVFQAQTDRSKCLAIQLSVITSLTFPKKCDEPRSCILQAEDLKRIVVKFRELCVENLDQNDPQVRAIRDHMQTIADETDLFISLMRAEAQNH